MEKEAPNRINERITVPQVRVVGDGIEGGSAVMPTSQALRLAREQELDLIEISPKAEPPVVRIADYQKFLYQQKRKAKELKAKTVKVTIKEIRFGSSSSVKNSLFMNGFERCITTSILFCLANKCAIFRLPSAYLSANLPRNAEIRRYADV